MRGQERVLCLLLLSGLALACGSSESPKPSGAPMARREAQAPEERSENHAPAVDRVVLSPQKPLPGGRVEARVDASDPDGDPVRLSYEWRAAGRVVDSGAHSSISTDGLHKGDEIEVRVTASDGRDESPPARATATVGNQAPLIQALSLAPAGEVRPGQEVTAVPQAVDPDGDTLQYEFEWLLNGQKVRGADRASFDTTDLKRGDRLQAHVRVSDGQDESPVAESMVLQMANRPPKIKGVPPIESEGGTMRMKLEAEDPDGDQSFRFRVLQGPPGLSVDPLTGTVTWKPAPGTSGSVPVEIAVADSLGAESAMHFELDVKSAGGGRAAAAAPPAKADDASVGEDEGKAAPANEAPRMYRGRQRAAAAAARRAAAPEPGADQDEASDESNEE